MYIHVYQLFLPPVGNTSLLVNNVPVRVGGLIGTATPSKDGLMHKQRSDYTYNKKDYVKAKITIKTTSASQAFSCILHFIGVDAKMSAVNLLAVKWNITRVYASQLCGENPGAVSLLYKIESNSNISVYVITNSYLRIDISPLIKGVSSEIEDIDTVPDDAVPLSF